MSSSDDIFDGDERSLLDSGCTIGLHYTVWATPAARGPRIQQCKDRQKEAALLHLLSLPYLIV
jgi:hypothetical protein